MENNAYFQDKKPALGAIMLILLGGVLVPITLDYSPYILPALLSGLFMGTGALILWRQLDLEYKDQNQQQNQQKDEEIGKR